MSTKYCTLISFVSLLHRLALPLLHRGLEQDLFIKKVTRVLLACLVPGELPSWNNHVYVFFNTIYTFNVCFFRFLIRVIDISGSGKSCFWYLWPINADFCAIEVCFAFHLWSFVMARHGDRVRMVESQVATPLIFEYLCGLGDTGTRFVTEALTRPVPDPRNDLRELLVDRLELYISRVEFQCGCVQLVSQLFLYWCFFGIYGDAIGGNHLTTKGATVGDTIVQKLSSSARSHLFWGRHFPFLLNQKIK